MKCVFVFENDNGNQHYLFDNGEWKPPLHPDDVRFAEMLAAQAPPQILTDSVFMAGIGGKIADMHPREQATMEAAFKRQGVSVPANGVYSPGLARFHGDAQAVITGRGDAIRLAEERGHSLLDSEGNTLVKAQQPEKDPFENPKHKLSPKIVKRNLAALAKKDPDRVRKEGAKELTEHIIEKHGPQ